jgi:hypothetical protein
MVITKLMGGLGNQMFQYAAGRALSLHHNTSLMLDTSFLDTDDGNLITKRKLELDIFNASLKLIDDEDLSVFSAKYKGGLNVARTFKKTLFYREWDALPL